MASDLPLGGPHLQVYQQFSLHPLTWLGFLGYAIYGKESYISREREGEQVVLTARLYRLVIITYRKASRE